MSCAIYPSMVPVIRPALLPRTINRDPTCAAVRSSIPGGGHGTADGTSMPGPHVAGLVALLLTPLTLVLWIVLMVKAFQGGERFKLPVVGDWAEEQAAV